MSDYICTTEYRIACVNLQSVHAVLWILAFHNEYGYNCLWGLDVETRRQQFGSYCTNVAPTTAHMDKCNRGGSV